MTLKRFHLLHRLHTPVTLLLILFLIAGCGGSDSSGPASTGGGAPDPKFSLPLPKGLLAPAADSGLTMTAKAVIDPGSAGARTVDLTVDSSANRVTGVIDGIAEGPHSIEIQYFINGVQVAIAALNVNVVAGQNTPVEISPTLVNYTEAVSNTLFVADGANASIAIFDHYSSLPGGTVQAAPTRTLSGPDTHISGPSSGGLFVDPLRGILYLTNAGNDSVAIWNNAATVSGNTPPDRLLAGAATRLNHPTGITVDPFRNRIYAVNQGGEILIWDNTVPVNGNTAPIASVSGASSALVAGDHPLSLDIKSDTLYVANGTGILVFDKLSQLTGDHQDVTPVPTIRIAGKPLKQAGLALDSNRDLLYLSSEDSNGT
ncbi:MAG TPA: hypothetical protein VFA47_09895, partial [Candidatus Manganitrophaceae bacterium]|nr:hypothetical protein [Candidatus Manganitrophaceae bacterium]